MTRTTLRQFALAVCLVGSIAVGAQPVAADVDCNCTEQGQCASGTCCFVNGECLTTGKVCDRQGASPNYTCGSYGTCTYTGPSCGGGA